MCGIFCFLKSEKEKSIHRTAPQLLSHRGPNYQKHATISHDKINIKLTGTTLHFRGQPTPLPLSDDSGNELLWNGEVFSSLPVPPDKNDTQEILAKLAACEVDWDVLQILVQIKGPFAFIFWQQKAGKLWFGRDVIGRRSMVYHMTSHHLVLSSVCDNDLYRDGWCELPADGIYCINANNIPTVSDGAIILPGCIMIYPWITAKCIDESKANIVQLGDQSTCTFTSYVLHINTSTSDNDSESTSEEYFVSCGDFGVVTNFGYINKALPGTSEDSFLHQTISDAASCDLCSLETDGHLELVQQLEKVLGAAVCVRVNNQPSLEEMSKLQLNTEIQSTDDVVGNSTDDEGACALSEKFNLETPHAYEQGVARVAVLYSGGIDSHVLAALADRYIPEDEPIDLLNVAFEKNCNTSSGKGDAPLKCGAKQTEDMYNVPDRVTGRAGLKCLNSKRKWNFVEVNVTLNELKYWREKRIRSLIAPLDTVLDDTIGCAVWFASRGKGVVLEPHGEYTHYHSTARVILSGMGADEQLAGYSRHRMRFGSGNWSSLIDEVEMDVRRISTRNLGRDDRVIADHGKEARFPFLDENVMQFLSAIPMWQKANLLWPRGIGEKFLLRLLAQHLGLASSAALPKRAIQFGSRIAKIENRKEKASDKCERLAV